MRRLGWMLAAVVLVAAGAAHGQAVRVDREAMKNSESVKALFKPVVAAADKATVIVNIDGKQAALGAIVDKDGFILTKASEAEAAEAVAKGKGKLTVTCGGKEFDAKIVGVMSGPDLAMLKIDAKDLTPVEWGDAKKLEVGQWVATCGTGEEPVAVGVISVGRRKIPGRSGFLGVSLMDAEAGGAKVAQVLPGSAAEKAGLQVDDVVTAVSGKEVKNRADLILQVRDHTVGDSVKLAVKRGEKSLEVVVTLGANTGQTGPTPRFDMEAILGGPVSKRASDFSAVYQHDTVIRPVDCGGPLVNLDGKVVGINIARAGRTETYALPADVILPLIADLKSGKLAPKDAAATQHAGQE